MLFKAIPRSFRAGVALVLLFIFLPMGLQALGELIVPGEHSVWLVIRCVGGLLIGVVAGITFYYFQETDGNLGKGTGLDTVHSYHKDRLEEERLRKAKVTPAYPPDEHHEQPPQQNN